MKAIYQKYLETLVLFFKKCIISIISFNTNNMTKTLSQFNSAKPNYKGADFFVKGWRDNSLVSKEVSIFLII